MGDLWDMTSNALPACLSSGTSARQAEAASAASTGDELLSLVGRLSRSLQLHHGEEAAEAEFYSRTVESRLARIETQIYGAPSYYTPGRPTRDFYTNMEARLTRIELELWGPKTNSCSNLISEKK